MGLNPGTQLGPYTVSAPLGKGGMGEVYRATDSRLNRDVAIKVLPENLSTHPGAMKRFESEAKALAALSHPNIVAIFDVGTSKDISFVVMELLEGMTLRNHLMNSKLSWQKSVELAIKIVEGLAAAHSKGVVHRDLKPENIWLTSEGHIKILDFGLARFKPVLSEQQLTDVVTESFETQSDIIRGTIPYMSPEQVRGESLDTRTDIFAFGAVLYEMLSGKRPFSGQTNTETMAAILKDEPAKLSELSANIPKELEDIVFHCLEKNRQQRFQSAQDLGFALRKLLPPQAAQATGPGHIPKTRKAAILKKASKAALMIPLIIVLLGVAAFLFKQRNVSPAPRGKVTLAVLPFTMLGSDDKNKHLSMGIADAIITRLSSVQDIRLAPTNAILPYKDKPTPDIQKVAADLKVEKILSGTIQQSDDRFRISVQLVQASDNSSLWGKQFNLTRQDLLELEDAVAEEVSRALEVRISDSERERLNRHYTKNTAAYEQNLLGRSQLLRYDKEGTLAAIDAFQKALELDPTYASAQAGLAMACADMHLRYASSSDVKAWGERAEKEAYRAVKLDPNLAEAHLALAAIARKGDFNWERTIQESKKALELNSNLDLPHYFIASAFYHLGLLDLSAEEVRKGLEISEENKVEALRIQGIVAMLGGNYAEAVRKLEEVQRISDRPISDTYLGLAYYYNGEKQKAIDTLQQMAESASASASSRAKATLASFYAASEKKKEAQEFITSVTSANYMDHHVAYSLGVAFAQLDQKEKALDSFNRAVDSGFPCYPMFVNDPLLKPLQTDANFQQFLQNLKNFMHSARSRYSK